MFIFLFSLQARSKSMRTCYIRLLSITLPCWFFSNIYDLAGEKKQIIIITNYTNFQAFERITVQNRFPLKVLYIHSVFKVTQSQICLKSL